MAAPASAAGPVTKTFFSTGAEQTYSVPPAAASVHVTAIGAPGGNAGTGSAGGLGGLGGFGGFVDGDLPTGGITTLFVEVGHPGGLISEGGGFGGAGAGMGFDGAGGAGGGGGGASDVRTCSLSAVTCNTLQSRLMIAGGGGGGGGGWSIRDGGAGGNAGQPGLGQSVPSGGGAGSASVPCPTGNGGTNNGEDGSLGFGGHGGAASSSTNYGGGGGGGGGLCGGGGGGAADMSWAAGGGGGSSFIAPNVVDAPIGVATTRTPSITITYTDATAPSIAIASPVDGATIPQGSVVAASYSCTDDQGGAGVATCSGPVPSGQPIDTSSVGTQGFTVNSTDNVGNASSKIVSYTVTPTAATLSKVTQSARTWREGNKLPHAAAKKRPTGTTFRYTLDKPARVVFRFPKGAAGRRSGKKCVKPTKGNRHRHACKRTVSFAVSGHAGANAVRFQGRVNRHTRLTRGRHTVVITAITPEGLKTKAPALKFRIVR